MLLLELDQFYSKIESSIIREEFRTMLELSNLIIHCWINDLHAILILIAELDWYVVFLKI